MTSVVIKKSLQNVAGSLNTRMPIRTVPTAPIPVHTGYAVPTGIVLTAFARNNILKNADDRKAARQKSS